MSGSGPRGDECQEACKRLFGYLDGALTAEQAVEFETHLARCGRCADAHAVERKLLAAIKSSEAGATDLELRRRILAALRAVRPGPST
jgi:anti-sigma factor (TIGR02949 family)